QAIYNKREVDGEKRPIGHKRVKMSKMAKGRYDIGTVNRWICDFIGFESAVASVNFCKCYFLFFITKLNYLIPLYYNSICLCSKIMFYLAEYFLCSVLAMFYYLQSMFHILEEGEEGIKGVTNKKRYTYKYHFTNQWAQLIFPSFFILIF
ncbi:hypothetical protein ACJX0J_039970, partial [Zea mays]